MVGCPKVLRVSTGPEEMEREPFQVTSHGYPARGHGPLCQDIMQDTQILLEGQIYQVGGKPNHIFFFLVIFSSVSSLSMKSDADKFFISFLFFFSFFFYN